jgi:hypothetical protein
MTAPKQHTLTWNEWVEQFRPMHNKFSKDPDNLMFETFGEEVAFVTKFADQNKVWTYLDTDGGSVTVEGMHYVNRIGYYVTEVPYVEDDSYEVDLEMYPECCEDCGEAETTDGELIMSVFKCDAQQEYCLNCCRCPEHVGEPWY